MFEKHLPLIEEAGKKGVQILCLQEVFNGPYFCPSQDAKWCDLAEEIPNGPTVQRLAAYAKKYQMALVVPIYEREMAGVYYNTAAVIDADGTYLGKYRKNHIPQTHGFWEKFFFKPGNLGYPTFQTRYAKIGVYICYDRHFPEGARLLGLNGAEIVFNPSATVAGLSQYLWKLEQPAHAVANGYFMGCINRVGTEAPWNIGKFYGTSYFVDPRGNFLATYAIDAYESASKAALAGGTSTTIEMICPGPKDDPWEAYQTWRAQAKGKSAVDYSFHMSVVRYDAKARPQFERIVKDGVAS